MHLFSSELFSFFIFMIVMYFIGKYKIAPLIDEYISNIIRKMDELHNNVKTGAKLLTQTLTEHSESFMHVEKLLSTTKQQNIEMKKSIPNIISQIQKEYDIKLEQNRIKKQKILQEQYINNLLLQTMQYMQKNDVLRNEQILFNHNFQNFIQKIPNQ